MDTRIQSEQSTAASDQWMYADWQPVDAQSVRRRWMEMMGLDADEINEYCTDGAEADFDEELKQYNAMMAIEDLAKRIDCGDK
jgi:hypothetical protein